MANLFKILPFLLCGAFVAAKPVDDSCVVCNQTQPEATTEKGIDVSHNQSTIDWKKVAGSGVKHAFIRMSEGGSDVDPNFTANWKGAQDAQINVNGYHCFRALNSTPQQQLKNIKKLLKRVKWNSCNNALAIHMKRAGNEKATRNQMADNLNALLTLIKQDKDLCQLRVFIYTTPWYWKDYVNWRKHDFSGYPLWIADWNVRKPKIPQPWKSQHKTWTWWQYTSKGCIDGIQGYVHMNRIRV